LVEEERRVAAIIEVFLGKESRQNMSPEHGQQGDIPGSYPRSAQRNSSGGSAAIHSSAYPFPLETPLPGKTAAWLISEYTSEALAGDAQTPVFGVHSGYRSESARSRQRDRRSIVCRRQLLSKHNFIDPSPQDKQLRPPQFLIIPSNHHRINHLYCFLKSSSFSRIPIAPVISLRLCCRLGMASSLEIVPVASYHRSSLQFAPTISCHL
jgi:hypothetical protein